jgi:hypothetical protein
MVARNSSRGVHPKVLSLDPQSYSGLSAEEVKRLREEVEGLWLEVQMARDISHHKLVITK